MTSVGNPARRRDFKLSFVISVPGVDSGSAAKMKEMAALGFDGVELAIRNPADIDVFELKKALGGLKVPALGTGKAYLEEGLSLSHPDGEVRLSAVKRIKDHIRLASRLDALVIIGLIRGNLAKDKPRQDSIDLLRESLSRCLDYAGETGVTLVLEPLNRYECNFLNNVPETVAFIRGMGHPRLKLLADSFHMNIEDTSFRRSLLAAAPYLRHVHFADSNRRFPGLGHINFAVILDTLAEINYNGYISGEMLPEPTELDAMKGFAAFMRQV